MDYGWEGLGLGEGNGSGAVRYNPVLPWGEPNGVKPVRIRIERGDKAAAAVYGKGRGHRLVARGSWHADGCDGTECDRSLKPSRLEPGRWVAADSYSEREDGEKVKQGTAHGDPTVPWLYPGYVRRQVLVKISEGGVAE